MGFARSLVAIIICMLLSQLCCKISYGLSSSLLEKGLVVRFPNEWATWHEGGSGYVEWTVQEQLVQQFEHLRFMVRLVSKRPTFEPIVLAEEVGFEGEMMIKVPGNCRCFATAGENTVSRYYVEFSATGFQKVVAPRNGFVIKPREVLIMEPPPLDPLLLGLGLTRSYDAGSTLTVSWRTDIPNTQISIHLIPPFKHLAPILLKAEGKPNDRINITLPEYLPTAKGYMLNIETKALLDTINVERGWTKPLSLRSSSVPFRIQNALIVFSRPNKFQQPVELGEKLVLKWFALSRTRDSKSAVLLKLISKADPLHRSWEMIRVQQTRHQATWQVPIHLAKFQSGYHQVVAFEPDTLVELGRSAPFYVYGYEAFVLFPHSDVVVGPNSAPSILNVHEPVDIRWIFKNPGHVVDTVSIAVVKIGYHRDRVKIATSISLANFPSGFGTHRWHVPWHFFTSFLNNDDDYDSENKVGPFRIQIIPDDHEMSMVSQSSPFYLTNLQEDDNNNLIDFALESESTFHSWKMYSKIRLPRFVKGHLEEKHHQHLSLYLIDFESKQMLKPEYRLDGNAKVGGSLFFHVPQLTGNQFVFLKLVDERFPAHILSIIGPFWISTKQSNLLEPIPDIVSYHGETIMLRWIPSDPKEENLYIKFDAREPTEIKGEWKSEKQEKGEQKDMVFAASWDIPCDCPSGTYTALERASGDLVGELFVGSAPQGIICPSFGDSWIIGSKVVVYWIVHANPCHPSLDTFMSMHLRWGSDPPLFHDLHHKVRFGKGFTYLTLPSTELKNRADYQLVMSTNSWNWTSDPFSIVEAPYYQQAFATEISSSATMDQEAEEHIQETSVETHNLMEELGTTIKSFFELHMYIVAGSTMGLLLLFTLVCCRYRRELRYIFYNDPPSKRSRTTSMNNGPLLHQFVIRKRKVI